MGKVRRTVGSGKSQKPTPALNKPFSNLEPTSVYSESADNVPDNKVEGVKKNQISKKLKLKLKHDGFVQKVSKANLKAKKPKTSKTALLNLNEVRSTIKEIASGLAQPSNIPAQPENPYFNPAKVQTKNQRNRTKRKEMERFQAVVNFSAFKDNPIKAVQTHLLNTLNTQPQP